MTSAQSDDRSDPSATYDAVETRIFVCPRCRVRAQHTWHDLRMTIERNVIVPFRDEEESPVRVAGKDPSRWKASHCQGCMEKSIWRNGVVVYPVVSAAPAPHALMPPMVRPLYEEAGQVLPFSRRAGAALARAALETLVRYLDKDGDSSDRLDERIARLSTRVSTPLAEGLDIVRFIGNDSLHGLGDQELVYLYLSDTDASVTMLLFETINDLVDELIARPEHRSATWAKLPQGVKDTITRKRKAAQEEAATDPPD